MPDHKFDDSRDALLWAQSPEGEEAIRKALDAQDVAREYLTQKAAGRFLVPGQRIKVHGEELLVIAHLDALPPGHYTATPDLSGSVEMDTAPLRVIFHPRTVAWAKETRKNPGKMLEDVFQGIVLGVASKGRVP